MTSRFIWNLAIFCAAGGIAAATTDDLLTLAVERNPDVRAARATARGRVAAAGPVGLWPDPMLGYGREKSPGAEETMTHWRVEQEIMFPGRPTQERRMAQAEARAAEAAALARSLDVRSEARVLLNGGLRADRRVARLERQIETLRSTLAAARASLASGGADPSSMGSMGGADVFSLEAERGRMENMLAEARADRRIIQLRWNALTDQPLDEPLPPVEGPLLPVSTPPLADLLRRAETTSPDVRRAAAESEQARRQAALARLSWAPDAAVMVDRQRMGMETGREIGVTLRTPLWFGRPRGLGRVARARGEEAEAMARAAAQEARRMTAESHAMLAAAREQSARSRDVVVPAARSAFEGARRRYIAGRIDLARLLQVERALREAEDSADDADARAVEAWGALERWTGEALETR
jgi:cobalt-zinc-cadmium efflux system outer membrane protein